MGLNKGDVGLDATEWIGLFQSVDRGNSSISGV